MKGRAIKPLALLVNVMALGLSATQPALAAEAQYQVGHTFSDSLETTVRPCTSSRCDIGGGFDRSSDTGYSQELPRLSGASNNPGSGGGWINHQDTLPGSNMDSLQELPHLSGSTSNPGGGGGWINQQDTRPGSDKDYGESLDYSAVLAGGPASSDDSCDVCQPKRAITLDELDASASGGNWANQQETIRLSVSQPGGGSGAGGGWANQQETIRLSGAQPTGGSGSGGGWINQQDTLPGSDKDYVESLDYSTVLAGGPASEESCSVCQPKRTITLDELDASASDDSWAVQPVEQSWLESNTLSRAVRPCTNNQCADDLPA